MSDRATLALRLAAPLQTWGRLSEAGRRQTAAQPTKAGIIGMLAAAQGLARGEPLTDLLELVLAVRIDQSGTVLRDYHTVSDCRGLPLLSASVDKKGIQRRTSPPKHTAVTQRFYLQDAVFVAAVEGSREFIMSLAHAVRHPAFPLALGARACVPTQPLVLPGPDGDCWTGSVLDVLRTIPSQARLVPANPDSRHRLPVTVDGVADPEGTLGTVEDVVEDVPVSFDQRGRGFRSRKVRHLWVDVPAGLDSKGSQPHGFEFLAQGA
jgi:CRISPR system Cascade subunit CasD